MVFFLSLSFFLSTKRTKRRFSILVLFFSARYLFSLFVCLFVCFGTGARSNEINVLYEIYTIHFYVSPVSANIYKCLYDYYIVRLCVNIDPRLDFIQQQ